MRKVVEIFIGILLVIIGLIGGILPGLPGFIVGIPGLIILSKHSPPVKKFLKWLKAKIKK